MIELDFFPEDVGCTLRDRDFHTFNIIADEKS